MDEQLFESGVAAASPNDIRNVMRAALDLQEKMYANENSAEALFWLRKSLESIWGHDLP
jgi:hypothetical protein